MQWTFLEVSWSRPKVQGKYFAYTHPGEDLVLFLISSLKFFFSWGSSEAKLAASRNFHDLRSDNRIFERVHDALLGTRVIQRGKGCLR